MNVYYLTHSGVKGMKWGVWNEETRKKRMGEKNSSRKFQRDLNKMDKQFAKEAAKQMQYTAKANKYARKSLAEKARGNVEKEDIFRKKAFEKMDKANEHYKKGQEIESKSWKKMGEAVDAGNYITTKQVIRDGRSFAERILSTGALPTLAVGIVYTSKYSKDGQRFTATLKNGRTFNQNPMTIVGTKYKVKKGQYPGISTAGFYNG